MRCRTTSPLARVSLTVLGALCGACALPGFERDLDGRVATMLADTRAEHLGDRAQAVTVPEPRPESELPPVQPAGPPTEREALVLTLREALEVAITSGRDYVTEKESLYLTALSLIGSRFAFSPQLTGALSYVFSDSEDVERLNSLGITAGVSQAFRTGGSVSLTGATGWDDVGGNGSFSSGLSLRLIQPLLRGAGYEVASGGLIQSERNLIYAIREFERFREAYSIDVAQRYYDLVQQGITLDNQRRTLEGVEFDLKKAEALFAVERVNELEVLRTKRQYLNNQNDLIRSVEAYALDLDRFRVFLGLPDTVRVEVTDEEPEFVAVDFDIQSAIAAMYDNRLDVLTERDRLEDSARGLRIARNGMLPDLDLSVNADLGGPSDPSFGSQSIDDLSYGASVTLGLPLNRVLERNSVRSSEIALTRAKRNLGLFLDNQAVSLRSRFRELTRIEQSLDIQRELIADQERNVSIARLRFDRGDVPNRDVVEAQASLLDAQNSLVREKVNYEIARLRLLREIGILFLDEYGMFRE